MQFKMAATYQSGHESISFTEFDLKFDVVVACFISYDSGHFLKSHFLGAMAAQRSYWKLIPEMSFIDLHESLI